jgi:hypothetical protein
MHTRGLSWGQHRIQLEYDYAPAVRPVEASRGGKFMAERILRDRASIEQTLAVMTLLKDSYGRIDAEADPATPEQPHWKNSWLPGVDAAILYSLVASRKPRTYLEIGSGNSTKFVRRAIRDHGLSTRIISVDPQPRAEVDAICDEVVRSRIEDVNIDDVVGRLSPGDVVFVDNSHRGFQNSDVTVCFMELLPALPVGTIFGVHDICLPFDYDPCFLDYFYNEQYYLGMYLLGGAVEDKILLPSYFASREPGLAPQVAASLDHQGIPEAVRGGSSFWLELGGRKPGA